MSTIASWLQQHGLGKYTQAFAENDVDLELLPQLSDDELKELGLSLGHRKKLRAALLETPPAGSAPDRATASDGTGAAERRQLTVMFCDLVESTALSARMDPEEYRAVIGAYQGAVTRAIEPFDGYVARYMGDGLLIYFGYPNAHEDDPERAVRAGLGIVDAVDGLGPLAGAGLKVRIGIATGLVVAGDIIGEGASEERAVLGETPNLAARLQAVAPPDAVVVAGSTLRLVTGLFLSEDLGAQTLKGIRGPVEAYRITGVSEARSRFEAAAARGLTPLVGRDVEIGLLLKRWEQTRDGEGQVVLLSGEAGVGKSRIIRAFQERVRDELRDRVLYFCTPHHRNSAFYPVIEQLERGLRLERNDTPGQKLDKLDRVLRELSLAVVTHAAVLASLLSVPNDGRYPPLGVGPEALRERTFDALLAMFDAAAARAPLLVVVEDAHWMDPSTEQLLGLLVERVRCNPILLVVTHRPEHVPSWGQHAHMTSHAFNRLTRRECVALVNEVASGKALPTPVLDEIVARTDGIPLFVEELTKTVLDSGSFEDRGDHLALTAPLPPRSIPASLQDALMARLDRLGPVKELAQLAATLGRSFSHEMLAVLWTADAGQLREALDRLIAAGLVYRRRAGADASYEFKHAMVQETAYQSLLKSRRQELHRRIAEVLPARYPDLADTEPEILARHFSEAGLLEQAIACWQRAGERAAVRSANLEAIEHFQIALRLLAQTPPDDARGATELAILLALGPALMATKGWAATEVEAAYARAHELCRRFGLPPQRFAATWGMWMFHQGRANHRMGSALAGELLQLSGSIDESGFLLQAHHASWTTRLFIGELDAAEEHIRCGLQLYDPVEHGRHALTYAGHDPGVCGFAQGAIVRWLKGFPDAARESSERAIATARQIGHAPSTAHALYFSARLSTMRREPETTLELVEAMMRIAEELQLGLYLVMGPLMREWALVELGRDLPGSSQLHDAESSWRAAYSGAAGPHNCFLIADAWRRQGEAGRAGKMLDVGLEGVERTGERYWEAELLRLKGELTDAAQTSGLQEREALFQRAMQVAKRQSARSLELRAAVAMARSLRTNGERAAARALLAPVYGWFTEGFDTVDLAEAGSLMETLC